MTTITTPTNFRPVEFTFGQMRFDTMERSDSTGAEAARLLAPPRWTVSLNSAQHMTMAEAGQWEAWLLKLRGGVNVAALYDPLRLTPEGGVTGTLKLVGDVALGATTMYLTGNANALGFDSGDVFQISTGAGSSHYGKVVADADPPGTLGTFTISAFTITSWTWGADANYLTVTFEPPTRQAFAQGTVVTISQPLLYARMKGSAAKWQYSTQARRRAGGFAVDFEETFSA